jgi:hypothetical protein
MHISQLAHNKPILSDQGMLSCLLLAQKPRQHTLAPDQGRYGSKVGDMHWDFSPHSIFQNNNKTE